MNAVANEDHRSRFVLAATAELSLGALAILLGWWFGPDARQYVPRIHDLRGIAFGGLVGIGIGVGLAVAMLLVSRLPLPGIRSLNESFEARFRELLAPMTYPELVVLAMTAGLGEELLFRGWLQSAMTGSIENPNDYPRAITGWLVASFLFGLAHPLSRAYIAIAAGMGLILGGLFLVTGNLLTAIAAHAAYDAVILIRWKWEEDSKLEAGDAT